MERVLVVDDDPQILLTIADVLEEDNITTVTCDSAEKALEVVKKDIFDALLTDLQLPGMDGLELIRRLHRDDPQLITILMTGFASIDSAIEAIQAGAVDYLRKPFNAAEIPFVLQRAEKRQRLESENVVLREELNRISGFDQIIGRSQAMQQVYDTINLVANTDSTVLIQGESGTGKELVARAIHQASPRKNSPMISINSSAIPETLLEDELFGHEKGAFTGASNSKQGRFERAHNGTLFLDEIGFMSPALQVKLLRVLQEREFERVGGTRVIKVDVRIITATSENLEQAIEEGRFRRDLYYRLNVINIKLPPLRDRREDIPILANHFIKKLGTKKNLPHKKISRKALRKLMQYDWPGNVRELENCIERAMIMSGQRKEIAPSDLTEPIVTCNKPIEYNNFEFPDEGIDLKEAVLEFEAHMIHEAMEKTSGVKAKAATLLGIKRTTLVEKMKKNPYLG